MAKLTVKEIAVLYKKTIQAIHLQMKDVAFEIEKRTIAAPQRWSVKVYDEAEVVKKLGKPGASK